MNAAKQFLKLSLQRGVLYKQYKSKSQHNSFSVGSTKIGLILFYQLKPMLPK